MKIGLIDCWLGITLYEPEDCDENSTGGWLHYSSEHVSGVKPGDVNYDREAIKKWVKEGNHYIGIYAPYWLAKFYLEEVKPDDISLARLRETEQRLKGRGWDPDKYDDFCVSV